MRRRVQKLAKQVCYIVFTVTLGAVPGTLHADTLPAAPDAVVGAVRESGLQLFDWVLIGLYAALTIVIGWYFGRKQRSAVEYFVGSRNMNPLLIGVSLFATLLSTITYLGKPGEVLGKGPVIMASLFGFPLVYLIVGYGLLPFYMKQRVTSAYELLEVKLGLGIRILAACMFILLRLFWMSLLVYLSAVAMTVMLGVDVKWIPLIVLVTGFVAIVYTSIGGLRAVVVTDLVQTLLLFGGAVMVIATVTFKMSGFGWFPTEWHANWDSQPMYSFDPRVRMTVAGSILMIATWYICTSGGDQTSVQRFMATRDAVAARRAFAMQLIVAAVVTTILGLVGFALLGFFQANLELLPSGMNLKENADKVFPYFIAYQLPVGVSGLVVSAMFAAAMSSIDSGVNSITAVVTTDFLDRFGRRPKTERGHLLAAKFLAFTIGAVVVVGSSFIGHVPGNIMAVTYKTTNLLVGPIFGLFFYALILPFGRPAGAWVGTAVGIATAAVIAFSGPLVTLFDLQFGIPARTFGVELETTIDKFTGVSRLMAPDPVSFQWIGPISLVANLATGTLVSWIMRRRASAKSKVRGKPPSD
jgi:SSS family solute:Na+ symporter